MLASSCPSETGPWRRNTPRTLARKAANKILSCNNALDPKQGEGPARTLSMLWFLSFCIWAMAKTGIPPMYCPFLRSTSERSVERPSMPSSWSRPLGSMKGLNRHIKNPFSRRHGPTNPRNHRLERNFYSCSLVFTRAHI
jgi:hypothetical protein